MKYFLGIITTICLFSLNVLADPKTEILMDKVDRMEAELALLQRKLYRNSESTVTNETVATATNIDDFYTQIDAQNQVIQNLTEKVERLEFELATLTDQMGKINADVNFRFNELAQQ